MVYCTEPDIYQATGQKTTVVQKLGGITEQQVTTMIEDMIVKATRMVKNELGLPITIRKEYHMFQYEDSINLGPEQDKLGFYNAYHPEGCVDNVFAIYNWGGRVKLPYPKNCDLLTEDIDGTSTGPNCTLSKDTVVFKCGTASIKAIFSAAGYFTLASDMDKNIQPWHYIGFWFKSSDKTAIHTLKLIDYQGHMRTMVIPYTKNGGWQVIKLAIGDFTNPDGIDFNINNLLESIVIEVNGEVTINIDNFCFNDGIFWTYPEGLICWSIPKGRANSGNYEFYATYAFDPYKLEVPEEVSLATAKKAGILLLEFLIGCRQRITAFTQTSDALDNLPDRETLEFRRAELQRQVEGILAGIGFPTYEGMSED